MEVGIVPIMVFLMPIHPLTILVWVLYMTSMNVLGHLGFELFPDGFASGKITKWHNTSTHHNMHHKYVTCNYGLYYSAAIHKDNFYGVQFHTEKSADTGDRILRNFLSIKNEL